MQIVIGIPAYNEGKNIARIIAEISKKGYSVIVCNDGSTDSTKLISEKMGATVINHSKNLGYGAGIRSIFQKAKEMNFDILVTFDADGQHRIEDLENVINPIIEKDADIVLGSRFLKSNSKNVPKYREIGIKAITKLTNVSINEKVTDSQSGFRAYNKKVLDSINPSEHGMGVSTEILIKASKQKFKFFEVAIEVLYDGDTSTHNPVSHGTSVIFSTMKFTAIEHPLKFYGIPGMVLLIVGLFFIVWTIQEFTNSREIITNLALVGTGATLIGTMLLITSIILYSLVNVVRENNTN
jgi:glycosyltransferase involved in cell wall biosynthesis